MLTSAQRATLDYHLRKTNLLTNEELIIELTDHYTTTLGDYLAQGLPFQAALTTVQGSFGGRKGLQKMERQYNRVTFRRYDALFMKYVREQGRWPHLLVPLLFYGLTYWATTHRPRPTIFSVDNLTDSLWGGFAIGATVGLILKFFQLVLQNGFIGRNLSYKAIYLATRFLPITLFQYVFSAVLVYYAQFFPPYVYEAALSACISITVTYMLSYSRFYQSVFKIS